MELSKHVDLTVHCQGADRPTAVALLYGVPHVLTMHSL
jgi:hypothetical protein